VTLVCQAQAGTFDYILCTVSAKYDMASYLNMLATDGKFIIVGAPPVPMDLAAFALIPNRKTVAGSLIGKAYIYFIITLQMIYL